MVSGRTFLQERRWAAFFMTSPFTQPFQPWRQVKTSAVPATPPLKFTPVRGDTRLQDPQCNVLRLTGGGQRWKPGKEITLQRQGEVRCAQDTLDVLHTMTDNTEGLKY